MQAWVFRTIGEPSAVLKLESDFPKPVPKDNQLLIKVHSAAINGLSWKLMKVRPAAWLQTRPAVADLDFSGVVVGGKVDGTELNLGDEVFGFIVPQVAMSTGSGTMAEYVVVDSAYVVKKPKTVSFAEAAGLPIAMLTAFSALFDVGKVKKGQRVFVNGGSGGVGQCAIQICKLYDIEVVTTHSPSSLALISSLNPTASLDYTSAPLTSLLASQYSSPSLQFDLIFDTVGVPELYHASPAYLKPEGVYVDIAARAKLDGVLDVVKLVAGMVNKNLRPTWLGGTPRKYVFCDTDTKSDPKLQHDRLVEGIARVADGIWKAPIDSQYSFDKVLDAYGRGMSGRAKGKLIVNVV
ncbi:hypothetical protein MNV49_001839 [Pseudohyphozyma bogoriensis]|nr:hypothetical protein MNV49_001839 [Pseudohyphozyma bogoriensis]